MTDTHFVRGATKIRRRIQRIQAGTQLVLNSGMLENLLLQRIKRRFVQEVDPDGRPWPPLEPATLRRKKNQKALQRTGDLLGAIRVIRGSHQGKFAVATGAGVRIGVDDPRISEYGRYQNNGFYHVRAQRRIASRRFLGVGELDRKAVDSLLRRAIIGSGLEG